MSIRTAYNPRSAWLGFVLIAMLIFGAGCKRPPWPPEDDRSYDVLERLNARHEQTVTASYRVRWQSIGTEPHATVMLEIAYKSPDRYRVTGEGPFGIPAFTAVLVGDSFWYIDHRQDALLHDHIDNLDDYQIPMAEFFSGQWRSLFAGGWGGENSLRALTLGLLPGQRRNEYEMVSDSTKWTIRWNHGKQAPRSITIQNGLGDNQSVVARIWYDQTREHYPFWKMKRLTIEGLDGGGEHRWRIIRQSYNRTLPDRLFAPLSVGSRENILQ